MQSIRIRGAREHNLKNIDVELPRDSLVVVTGLSGSGKSSLAFDTVYAEGQRRYVESLSAYARQFLELMQKPEVESIEGLSPAISIEQKTTSRNPRSTVATVTEIYDYMRLLWARVGIPYSPATGLPIVSQTVSQMVDRVLALPERTRLYLLAPIARGRKGEYRRELADLKKRGFQRVKIDGKMLELDEVRPLNKNLKHDISVVVDRIVVSPDLGNRLADSFETALELADGLAIAENADSGEETIFSAKFACPVSGFTIPEIEPRLFSFNNPFGACPACDGLGTKLYFDPGLVVHDEEKSLAEGAVNPWAHSSSQYYTQTLESIARHFKQSMHTPWCQLPQRMRQTILDGSAGTPVKMTYDDGLRKYATERPFEGVLPNMERRFRETDSAWVKEELGRYQSARTCEVCNGDRLKPEALAVKIAGKNISEVARLSISDALSWFSGVDAELTPSQREIAERILKEINERLGFLQNVGLEYLTLSRASGTLSGGESQRIRLASQIGSGLTGVLYVLDEPSIGLHQRDNARLLATLKRLRFLSDVGLDYLTLDRSADTLSGGEAQRIRLASQIGSGLVGVMYILDEPSIGLHQRDNDRLLRTLNRLRDLGNTVIVVEHDEDAIRHADHVVDLGPGAGVHGGQVIVQGTPDEIAASADSITGQYLSGQRSIAIPPMRTPRQDDRFLRIINARGNNLRNVTVDIPLGVMTCVTGVSGSGKSTLVNDTLYQFVARKLNDASTDPAPNDGVEGLEHIDRVIDIDQSPIGRTPRSNPATYTGLFTPIRDIFAAVPEARARGYEAGRFSFNVKGGRCEACQGDGVIKVEMHFLPDVYVPCDVCKGRRYNRETLEIRYKGRNINEVLEMTVEDAFKLFEPVPALARKLETLIDVGLSYIKLGQSATTLSGGEAQRVKLSRELSKRDTGRTLYILDEPTTGLHFEDTRKLLDVLTRLVDQGNTIVVIEHNLDVIKSADHVI
ncbi:MAG TPA: excinuclease ABC subunit UvrA, partial [Stellaceae bacterium]